MDTPKKRRPMSAETKAKLSATRKGYVFSAESRARMSAARSGMKLSEEHKAKISAATKGKPKSKDHVEKVRKAMIGFYLAKQHPERLPRTVIERRRHLKRSYGLTEEDVSQMISAQGGACAICQTTEEPARGWNIDHCHATGDVRGILCINCNMMLGMANDRPEVLAAAIEYLAISRSKAVAS
jgi:hypothetical protein